MVGIYFLVSTSRCCCVILPTKATKYVLKQQKHKFLAHVFFVSIRTQNDVENITTEATTAVSRAKAVDGFTLGKFCSPL